jgi:hemolysin activation/secretion protein
MSRAVDTMFDGTVVTRSLRRWLASAALALLCGAGMPLVALAAELVPAPSDPGVLREWQLPELRSLRRADLDALLRPWLGRDFGLAEQQAVRKLVLAELEARGLGLGGVALRPVPGRPGAWWLLVVEPRLRRIDFTPGVAPPLSDARVLALLAAQGVQPGELLDLRALDQALYRLNDLPGLAATATLAPSGDEGVYDLVIERSLRHRVEGSAELDNHGSRYNGRYRLGALLRVNEPLDLGDNLDARLLVSDTTGLVSARLGYELPLAGPGWDSGWRAGLGLSSISYELGDTFALLQAHGRAEVADVSLSRPLQRSRRFNLIARLGASHKRLQDRFDALPLVIDKSASDLNAALSFEARDEALGGGYSGGNLALLAGRLHIHSAQADVDDAALGRRATRGTYVKASLQLSRLQALPISAWSIYGGLSAQWAPRNLDASEKFALGGATAVRAYAPGEAAADRGLITSLELRRALGARWSVFALFDWGHAELQSRPASGAANGRTLSGHGLGAFFSDPELFTLRAVLAWRGSGVPQAEPASDAPRLNLQLTRGF